MSHAFAQLHPGIQEAIYRLGWDALRPLQADAIAAVLGGSQHVILSAATAAGKTEAAFLPVLSRICEQRAPSVQALYISPLKALINDQFGRLEQLCEAAEIPVHRWHGDVSATEKQRLRREPAGVLLITPESLESQFVNHDRYLQQMYAGLEFVVIDELHAFLDSVRGIHLQSLLSRLEQKAGVQARRLGLSATLGDFAPACAFLHQAAPDEVLVLKDEARGRDLLVSVKSFLKQEEKEGEGPPDSETEGMGGVAENIALCFRREANLIFCNRRQDTEVLADRLRSIAQRDGWEHANPFLVHHGSLSSEHRHDVEQKLKAGEPVTALCTGTLEMGIDIGAVKTTGQVGAPWTVASLVQRIGRSGRKEGQPQILRLYTLDEKLHAKSGLEDRLFPELIRAIATVELHLEKWLEPPPPPRAHYSTLVHQILSVLRQTGGLSAALVFERLCMRGPFCIVTAPDFAALLRGLRDKELIEQMPTGEIILAPAGERIVESRDFYAAFTGSVDYSIEHHGTKIGVLPLLSVPPVGEHLLLAGRRWVVEDINHDARRAEIAAARGWKRPWFAGQRGDIHERVMQRMRDVLRGDGGFSYLDKAATERLTQAREVFKLAGLHISDITPCGDGTLWFPWQGSAKFRARLLHARACGVMAEWDSLSIEYPKMSRAELNAHARNLAEPKAADAIRSVLLPDDVWLDRFDEYVPMHLLTNAFLRERFCCSSPPTLC